MPTFLVFCVCVFASGFGFRVIDPIVLPLADQFDTTPAAVAALNAAFALPYAFAQPFLGPLGDRIGKLRCIRICSVGLSLALLLGALAPSLPWLFASRVCAGIFGGGLIPLVLASVGEHTSLADRQVMIGRMLFAIIGGQMLGPILSGITNDAMGWRAALALVAAVGLVSSACLLLARARDAAPRHGEAPPSATLLYQRVFANPKAAWLYACVFAEGVLFFSLFPHVGTFLLDKETSNVLPLPTQAGLVVGAFGIGGLLYAIAVRRLLAALGAARMCGVGASVAAACCAVLALASAWWLLAGAMLLAGFGFYMIHNSLQTQATELAPTARGSAMALFACGLFAGQGIGPLLFEPLARAVGFGPALLGLGAACLLLGQVVVRRVMAEPPGAAVPSARARDGAAPATGSPRLRQ